MKNIVNHFLQIRGRGRGRGRGRIAPLLVRMAGRLTAILFALALIAALAVPPWLKSTLEHEIGLQTGRQFTVERVSFNPFTLRVTLSNLQLLEADNVAPALSAGRLSVRVSPVALLRLAPVVGEIVLVHPRLHLLRSLQQGREVTNFSDVIRRLQQQPSAGTPLRFSVSNIRVQEGEIELDDRIAGKKIHIEALAAGVPFLSNFPSAQDVTVEPSLSARVDGSLVELKARARPFAEDGATSLAIDIDHFHLNELTAFAPQLLPVTLKSAILTTSLNLTFNAQQEKQNISLSGEIGLDDVELTDASGAALYASKKIVLNIADADLTARRFALNALELRDPQIWLAMDERGGLNWPVMQAAENSGSKKAPDAPVLLNLKKVSIKDGTVHWSDANHASPALHLDLANISLAVNNLSNHPGAEAASVSFSAGKNRQLQFDGSVTPEPMQVSGEFSLADLALQDYQAYFNRVLAADISAGLGAHGALEFRQGNLLLRDLALSLDDLSIQPLHHEDGSVLAKRIAVDGLSIDAAARKIDVNQIMLKQLRSQIFRDAKGDINLTHLLKSMPSTASATPPPRPWQADIRQLALSDSSIAFGDRSVQPAVALNVEAIDLKLDNISSKLDRPVNIALRSTVNKSGQFNMEGSATARGGQFNLDLRNVAVATLQPYFTQFLNIQIAGGSISTHSTLQWIAPARVHFQGAAQEVPGLEIKAAPGTTRASAEIKVPQAKLWWTWDHGPQNLYKLEASTAAGKGLWGK